MSLTDKIEALTDDQVFEVARAVLPDLVGVYDYDEAPARVAEALALSEDQAKAFRAETEAAAKKDPVEIAALLRLALVAVAEEGNAELVEKAVEDAGNRMTVVGIDLIVLGAFLLVGYVAVKTGGKEEETTTKCVETGLDGTVKVTIEHKTKYLDSLSAIGSVFRGFFLQGS